MIRGLVRIWLFITVAYWAYNTLLVDDDTQSKDLFYRFDTIFPTLEKWAGSWGLKLDTSGFLVPRVRSRRWMILRTLAFTISISLVLKVLLTKVKTNIIGRALRGLSTLSFALAALVIAFFTAGDMIHFYILNYNPSNPLNATHLVDNFSSHFP